MVTHLFRASHGTALLTEDQIREEYGEKRHWSHYEDFIDKVDNLASSKGASTIVNIYLVTKGTDGGGGVNANILNL